MCAGWRAQPVAVGSASPGPGGLSPVLATGGWLIADAVQPASYSPIRKTVSVLAGHAGTDRWIMTGALFLVGGCQLVTAVGLAGTGVPARILLAVAGLCSIGIAVSPEPTRGSTPQHLAWTSLGAVVIAVWPAFAARRAPPRPLILSSYGRAVMTAVFMALLGWLVIETRVATTWAWLSVCSYRSRPAGRSSLPSPYGKPRADLSGWAYPGIRTRRGHSGPRFRPDEQAGARWA